MNSIQILLEYSINTHSCRVWPWQCDWLARRICQRMRPSWRFPPHCSAHPAARHHFAVPCEEDKLYICIPCNRLKSPLTACACRVYWCNWPPRQPPAAPGDRSTDSCSSQRCSASAPCPARLPLPGSMRWVVACRCACGEFRMNQSELKFGVRWTYVWLMGVVPERLV